MKHSPTGFVSLGRPEEENLPVSTDANPEGPPARFGQHPGLVVRHSPFVYY
jgi:hypothetical protein